MRGILPYGLHDDVSYCQVDDGLVFLDIERDRYFRLPHALEAALLAYISGNECPQEDIDALVAQNVLTTVKPTAQQDATVAIGIPSRSNIERMTSARRVSMPILLEVLAVVLLVGWQLKRRKLKDVLDATRTYRRTNASRANANRKKQSQQSLIEAADWFRYARPYVPIEPICLLDSLAMARFLARRGLYACIVFGITADPFSAHCWVQCGDLVLNDTVGHANGYTRIRVV